MQSKDLKTETMDITDEDYRSALMDLYKHYAEDIKHCENKYKDWTQTSQIYALSKVDGSGRPVPANIKAYNETVVERRKLSVTIKFLRNELSFIEQFWTGKGFDLKELQDSVKSKELRKFNTEAMVKPKEQVADTNTKKSSEEVSTENPHKTLIVLKSEQPKEPIKAERQETKPEMEDKEVEDNIEGNEIRSMIEDGDTDNSDGDDTEVFK